MKVRVKIGTLGWEAGTFQQGDVFEVDAERFKLFDPNDVEAVEETVAPVVVEEKPTEPTVEVTELPVEEVEPKPKRKRAE